MYKSVLVNSDIHKYSEVNYISHSTFQHHTFLQIFHLKDICAKDWLWHLITRITRRFLKLLDNITKRNLTDSKFFCKLLIISDCKTKSCQLMCCDSICFVPLLLQQLFCCSIRFRMNTCSIKWILTFGNTHKTCALLERFRSEFRYFKQFFSVCKTTVFFSVSHNIFCDCTADS